MFSRSTLQRFMLALTVLIFLAAGITASSADAAVNFAGKRITIIVPFAPGGGSDTLSRYLSPFFQKYLPGNPAIIVRNVPGAGSIKGSNMIEEVKKDGLTILCASSSTMMNVIFQDKRIKFNVDKWIPIFNGPMGNVIYARTDLGLTGDPVKDLKMLKETQKQVIFGGNSPTSGEFPRLLAMNMLGLNVKPVFGLNRGDVRLPFERGEFNINYDSMNAYLLSVVPLIKSGVAVPLFSFGVWDAKKKQLVRDTSVPDIPHFGEVYEGVYGKQPSGSAWKVLLATMNSVVMSNKIMVLPSGTPKDIAETWHTVCEKIVKDEKFMKEKIHQIGDYDIPLREEAKENLMIGTTIDDESRDWMRNFLVKEYGIKWE